jgi:hypothetical protein
LITVAVSGGLRVTHLSTGAETGAMKMLQKDFHAPEANVESPRPDAAR